MLGRFLDRACFWNLPGVVRSYRLPVAFEAHSVGGVDTWYIPGRPGGPTVVFCHGNAGNLRFPGARGQRFLALHQAGAHLWAFDYRGYGNSPGAPSEAGLYEDAKAVHVAARKRYGPSEAPFVLYGRSLGGAVATYLATEVETPDALMVESTFTSAPDVCAYMWDAAKARHMSYRFDSLSRIARLDCPLYAIHGTDDWVVPYRFGKQLFEACPTARDFFTVAGAGHNDLCRWAGDRYQRTLERWLAQVGDLR